MGAISDAKNRMQTPAEYMKTKWAAIIFYGVCARVYRAVPESAALKKNNAMDFDDLLLINTVCTCSNRNPEVLDKYSRQVSLYPCGRIPGYQPRPVH